MLPIRTGAQALSRVAEVLAGDDWEAICQRPMDAAPVHDQRLGRAVEARWTVGLDRRYGAVLSPAFQRDALDLARLQTEAPSLKLYGAYARADDEGPRLT